MKLAPRLVREISLRDFGANDLFIGDLNGDGKPEMIFKQDAGMESSRVYAHDSATPLTGWTKPEDQALFCLTACDLNGEILWQVGEPWKLARPYRTHGGGRSLVVHDIDGDGSNEVIYLRADGNWGRIVIAEGSTGRTKKCATLPADNFSVMKIANFSGNPYPQEILIKVNDWGDWGYANPVLVLDRNLEAFWPQRKFLGAGHSPYILDADGDGRDEAIIGYNLVDHNGEILWTLDIPGHEDSTTVTDVNDDGKLEIVQCGHAYLLLISMDGKIIWKKECHHPQTAHAAQFRKDIPGKQILLSDREPGKGGTYLLRSDGTEIWRIPPLGSGTPVAWPSEMGEAQIIYQSPPPDGQWGYQPLLLNSNGEMVFQFPVPPVNVRHITQYWLELPERARTFTGDFGGGYMTRLIDLDGDGKQEVLIYNRNKLWMFSVTEKT